MNTLAFSLLQSIPDVNGITEGIVSEIGYVKGVAYVVLVLTVFIFIIAIGRKIGAFKALRDLKSGSNGKDSSKDQIITDITQDNKIESVNNKVDKVELTVKEYADNKFSALRELVEEKSKAINHRITDAVSKIRDIEIEAKQTNNTLSELQATVRIIRKDYEEIKKINNDFYNEVLEELKNMNS